MSFRGPLAILCLLSSCGTAVASPVQSGATPPQITEAGQTALQLRFVKAQKVARADAVPFEILVVDDQRSFFAQRNDGLVRLPRTLVKFANDPAIVDAMALIALSYATHRPPVVQQLGKTAKIVAGVAGFVGREIAVSRASRAGARQTDLLAQPVVNNPDRLQDPNNPMVRGVIWAKANGACEARLVATLKSMARQDTDATLRQDAVGMLRALGSIAWMPDDRCTA